MTDHTKTPPLYQAIFDLYRKRIENGTLSVGDPIPSEAQLAQLHGVSNITARRVLNELKRQGLVVRERGRGSFVAGPINSPLKPEATGHVMLIFPMDSQYTKAAEFIASLYTLLEKRGYYLGVHFSNDNEEQEARLLQQAIDEGTEGILLYPVSSTSNVPLLLRIRALSIPLVMIDRTHIVPGFATVVNDGLSGGRMLTDYLLSRGYEHIVFVSNHPLAHATTLRDRYHGYITALLRAGRSIYQTTCYLLPDSPDQNTHAYQNLLSLLRDTGESTALLCVSDPVAISLMSFLQANGLRVPEDVAVTGFDNLALSSRTTPPLTTVEQDFCRVARIAGGMLLSAMEDGDAPPMVQQVPVSLVIRESAR